MSIVERIIIIFGGVFAIMNALQALIYYMVTRKNRQQSKEKKKNDKSNSG